MKFGQPIAQDKKQVIFTRKNSLSVKNFFFVTKLVTPKKLKDFPPAAG